MKLDKLVNTVVAALEDVKAHDIKVLDVTKITTLFDRMIIAGADSTRQTRALANNVQGEVKAAGGAVYGIEGGETGEWVLVDLGDVLVHIMQTTVRAYYNLEDLWAEAEALKVKKIAASTTKSKAAVKPRKIPLKPAAATIKAKSSQSKKSRP